MNGARLGHSYGHLPDSTTHIRLIEVLNYEHDIVVSITTVGLRSAPPYHAVSYTWGEVGNEETILISKRIERAAISSDEHSTGSLQVRKNCADVLRQLHHFSTSTHYWIDAICINQEDEEEKTCQVALMHSIFGRAECVLACIGMHMEGDDSQYLATTLKDFENYLTSAGLSSSILTTRQVVSERSLIAKQRRKCMRAWRCWIEATPDSVFERFYRALDQLPWRPYFWRIWILQELYLAQSVRIFCGFDELNLSTLLLWWRESKVRFMAGYDDSEQDPIYGSDTRPFFMDKFGAEYFDQALWINNHFFIDRGGSFLGNDFEDMLYAHQDPYSREDLLPKMSMNKLLDLCKYRECNDSRDCIYGTLAIGRWTIGGSYLPDGATTESGAIVTPDYTRSVFDLAMLLLPNFHSDLQISQLVLGLLGLSQSDEQVQQNLSLRRDTQFPVPESFSWQNGEDRRTFVQLVHGGIQLGAPRSWSISWLELGEHSYSRINNTEGECSAVAHPDVRSGDWLLPTYFGRGLILRKVGMSYTIVGKAWCPPKNVPDDLQMTAFLMWYDAEDLLVHIAAGLQGLTDYTIDPPRSDLLQHLHVKMCASPNSSFGQAADPERRFSAEEYREYAQTIWKTVLRDWKERTGITNQDLDDGFD